MKDSQRVQITKGLLKEALLDLLQGKTIDQITVSELCRKAGVNRNTFYSHYVSPEELFSEIEHDFSEKIFRIIENTVGEGDYYLLLLNTLNAMAEEPEVIRTLLQEKGNQPFLTRFISIAFKRVMELWDEQGWKINSEDQAMIYRFVTGGAEWIVFHWLQEGMRTPPEKLARKLSLLTGDIIEKYSGKSGILDS